MGERIWDLEKSLLSITELVYYKKILELCPEEKLTLKNVTSEDLQKILTAFDIYYSLGEKVQRLIELLEKKGEQ